MHFSGFVEGSGKARSTQEVYQLLCEAISPLDFRMVAFLAVTAEAQAALVTPEIDTAPFLASNYPGDYLRHYVRQHHFQIDPALLLARESLSALTWRDIQHMPLSPEQKLLEIERREAGIYDEVTCPIHAAREQIFAVRFARGNPGEDDRAHLSALQVLAIHFYYAVARIHQARHAQDNAPDDKPIGLADCPPLSLVAARVLSHREKECLLWTARGKSASTISVILGLSENTINFYVKNAMRKLGTTNRVVAVVMAVRNGLIQP